MSIRVAIVDNGIYFNQGPQVLRGKASLCYEKDFWVLHHGDICASIINSFGNDIDIFDYRVFGKGRLSSSRRRLISCMRRCLKDNIKVINLSLGSTYAKDFLSLDKISRELAKKGIIIVSSICNDNRKTMPAFSTHTIGVGCDERIQRGQFYCVDKEKGLFMGAGTQQIKMCNQGTIMTPSYSSFATPIMIGNILNILEKEPSLDVYSIVRRLNTLSTPLKKITIDYNDRLLIIKIYRDYSLAKSLSDYFESRGFASIITRQGEKTLFKSEILIRVEENTAFTGDEDIYIYNQNQYYIVAFLKDNRYVKCSDEPDVKKTIKKSIL